MTPATKRHLAESCAEGDLLRTVSQGEVAAFYVLCQGEVKKLPRCATGKIAKHAYDEEHRAWLETCGMDWEGMWHGSRSAGQLVCLAGATWPPSRGFLLLALDGLEPSMVFVRVHDGRLWRMLQALRTWARGEEEDEAQALRFMADSVRAAKREYRGQPTENLIDALLWAFDSARGIVCLFPKADDPAAAAVTSAVTAVGLAASGGDKGFTSTNRGIYYAAIGAFGRELARLLRARWSLSTVCLLFAGEPR